MRRITLEEFTKEATRLYGKDRKKWKFICPICGTEQSAEDLVNAGVSKDEVNKYIGFSCIGRWLNSGPYDKNNPKVGCDWTLGGLFSVHKLEIIDYKGDSHPRFELAPKEDQDV